MAEEAVEVHPAARPLRGVVRVPGDKSISHRALLMGALCERGLEVVGLGQASPSDQERPVLGRDVQATWRALEALGARVEALDGGRVRVRPGAAGGFVQPSQPIDCANSGTTMRLLCGVLASWPLDVVLEGDASLSRRPMERVAVPLRAMGADVQTSGPAGTAPVRVRGRRPLEPLRYELPVGSAQLKSAVLLAGLGARGRVEVHDPFGSRDHTERMLTALAGGRGAGCDGTVAWVDRPHLEGGIAVRVPGDLSSAAFWLGAAAVVEGSDVVVEGVGLNPGRTGFLEVLEAMGARVETEVTGHALGEPVGRVRLRWAPLRGVHVGAEIIARLVDEVPIVAVVAALARGTTRIDGLGELRHKESNRLERVAAGLRALGGHASVRGDSLWIEGRGELLPGGGLVETAGDHRIAMAFAVGALASRAPVRLSEVECVAVSYPGFVEALRAAVR